MRYCLHNIPHTYVYRKYRYLTAGVQYIWETRDLQKLSWFQTHSPDTYMYLVRGTTIVARNDDYNGLASLIGYVPSISGSYYLIVRAYSKYSYGTCDVYESVGGGSPTRLANNVKFGGYPVSARWKSDERIFTKNATGDTYLYIIHGNTMLRDDDSGAGYCSSIRPGYGGSGLVVVGSYSTGTQGSTSLCNYYMSYLDNPGHKDEVDDPRIIISKTMDEFRSELVKKKPSLEELSYEEQEKAVIELRESILTKDDIKQLEPPKIEATREFIAASERYDEILATAKVARKERFDPEHAERMARIEFEKREIFRDLVPQESD